MQDYKYISFKIACQQCGFEKSDREMNLIPCNIIKTHCEHFEIIFIKSYDKVFRCKMVYHCIYCSRIKNVETNLGKTLPNGNFIMNDSDSYNCCHGFIRININLHKRQDFNNMINNSIIMNNIMPNNNNTNNNNDINYNNMLAFDNSNEINEVNTLEEILKREKEEFEKKNVIEFNNKDKIIYFMDDKSKKSYKIYTKSEMKVKDVIDDLENQFPELNVRHRKLKYGNRDLNVESQINSFSINESNIILLI